jgi:hypothetical protein
LFDFRLFFDWSISNSLIDFHFLLFHSGISCAPSAISVTENSTDNLSGFESLEECLKEIHIMQTKVKAVLTPQLILLHPEVNQISSEEYKSLTKYDGDKIPIFPVCLTLIKYVVDFKSKFSTSLKLNVRIVNTNFGFFRIHHALRTNKPKHT